MSKKRITTRLEDQKNTDMFLKKHVGLIHCENKLTLIQRKICNILLFNALDHINEQEVHDISLKQLCSLVGYNSNDSKLIKESIKSLISVVMEWNLLEDDSKRVSASHYPEQAITWNASALLAGASIKAGLIKYSYSPQIRSILSSLDMYGRINLFVQSKFNSSYSLVLYENTVRFKSIKQTAWFPIELFRSLMGVSDDKYPSFKEFNRNVINVAVKEVNQKSDIWIEPHFKKTGRKISAVQFSIQENAGYAPSFRKMKPAQTPAGHSAQSTLVEHLLSEYQLSEKQAHEIVSRYEKDYIVEKINLIKARKNITHSGAYLIAALQKDFKLDNNVSKKGDDGRNQDVSHIRESKEASEIRSLKNKYTAYKIDFYMRVMQQQPEQIQNDIKEQFEKFLAPNTNVFRLYKKSRFSSGFARMAFIGFMENNFNHLLTGLLSFDDYIISEDHAIET